jgi:3-hydroxyacyl-CoA dehydrogenase
VPLPQWVSEGPAASGVHAREGAYSPAKIFKPGRGAVYRRQYYRSDPGREVARRHDHGADAVRVWHTGTTSPLRRSKQAQYRRRDVLDGLLAAIAEAEKNWRGLVIWRRASRFR